MTKICIALMIMLTNINGTEPEYCCEDCKEYTGSEVVCCECDDCINHDFHGGDIEHMNGHQ